MEHTLQLGAGSVFVQHHVRRVLRRAIFVPPSPGGIRPCTGRRAKGHLMQPRAQRIPDPQAAGLLDQNQERGLKRILGVVRVCKLRPTNAQHHCPVPLDQRLESQLGDFAPIGREPFEQLPVRQLPDRSDIEERA